jgi:YVTN family beta-propeller protein
MGVLAAAIAVPLFALGGGHPHRTTGVTVVSNSVVVIDPATDDIVADIPVGDEPAAMAYANHALWVGNAGNNTVSRIDADTLKATEFGVPLKPGGIAFGGGALWVAGIKARATPSADVAYVVRFDPSSDNIVDTIPIGPRTDLSVAMAASADGIWVGHRAGPELVRIDPATDEVAERIQNIDPTGIAVSQGALWVSDRSGSAVVRLNGSNRIRTTISLGSSPYALAFAGEKLWVAAGRDELWRILPASNSVDKSLTVGVFQRPGADSIASSSESVWVARIGDAVTPPAIVRINAKTLARTTIRLPRPPKAIAVGAGRIWVAVH